MQPNWERVAATVAEITLANGNVPEDAKQEVVIARCDGMLRVAFNAGVFADEEGRAYCC